MILNEADLKVIRQVEHRNQEVSDLKFSPGEKNSPPFNRQLILPSFRRSTPGCGHTRQLCGYLQCRNTEAYV